MWRVEFFDVAELDSNLMETVKLSSFSIGSKNEDSGSRDYLLVKSPCVSRRGLFLLNSFSMFSSVSG